MLSLQSDAADGLHIYPLIAQKTHAFIYAFFNHFLVNTFTSLYIVLIMSE